MSKSVIIDVVIASVLIIYTILGWQRGLIRTLTELAVVALALGLAAPIAKIAAPKIVDQYLRPSTYAAIEQKADEITRETDEANHENLSKLMEAIPIGFIRETALDAVDGLFEGDRILREYAANSLTKLGKDVADNALDTLVNLVESVLCSVLFVVLNLVLRIAARALRLVRRIPVIRELDGIGGAGIGLSKGLILTCLVVWVLTKVGTITPEMAENSIALALLPAWITGAGK